MFKAVIKFKIVDNKFKQIKRIVTKKDAQKK